jgi:hypothetical protein
MLFNNSISQVIYLESDIQTFGTIYQIKYRFRGSGQMRDFRPYQFYMGTTDNDDFGHWIHPENFTLVFEGNLPTSDVGERDILIELDTPFHYTSGNLIIMGYRQMSLSGGGGQNLWQITELNRNATKIQGNSGSVDLLPNLGLGTIHGLSTIPNTTIFISPENMGYITGSVTADGIGLSGVNITIEGTYHVIVTDEIGNYRTPYLFAGNITMNLLKTGYYPLTIENIEVIANENTIENIEMVRRPTVNISGRVIASDTGEGFPGCAISLTGYADYTNIYSDEFGYFIIPEVFSENCYTLSIYHYGYVRFAEEIEVLTENIELDAITLQEKFIPASNVQAKQVEQDIVITWDKPAEIDRWFSYVVGDDFDTFVASFGSSAKVAHRYIPCILQDFGVVGGILTKVSFYPRTVGTFTIGIYTDGSDFEPGSLVHEQDVIIEFANLRSWYIMHLTTPVFIHPNKEMWITLEVNGYLTVMISREQGSGFDGLGNKVFSPVTGWRNLFHNGPAIWLLRGYAEAHPGNINRYRTLLGYDIYRFTVEDLDIENNWTEVAIGHTDTFFVDSYVPVYQSELYQYVIFARYSNENVSIPVYSNVVDYKKKVTDLDNTLPIGTMLIGNYPNPFNPETVISFQVGTWIALSQAPRNEKVIIEIFNIKGQKIRTLIDDLFAPGTYFVVWNGRDDLDREVGSGIYFYRMQTEELTETRKMVLIK